MTESIGERARHTCKLSGMGGGPAAPCIACQALEPIGTCGHTPERIDAKIKAHEAEVREHVRQEENVLGFVKSQMCDGCDTCRSAMADAEKLIARARRAEER